MNITPTPNAGLPTQSEDGRGHLAYYDSDLRLSFVWNGASDVVEVSHEGYGEPVSFTIPAPRFIVHTAVGIVNGFAIHCREAAPIIGAEYLESA
jgi:hypothetical protein